MKPPKWVLGDGPGLRTILVHLESPRFWAEVVDDLDGVPGYILGSPVSHLDLGGDGVLIHVTGLDGEVRIVDVMPLVENLLDFLAALDERADAELERLQAEEDDDL